MKEVKSLTTILVKFVLDGELDFAHFTDEDEAGARRQLDKRISELNGRRIPPRDVQHDIVSIIVNDDPKPLLDEAI